MVTSFGRINNITFTPLCHSTIISENWTSRRVTILTLHWMYSTWCICTQSSFPDLYSRDVALPYLDCLGCLDAHLWEELWVCSDELAGHAGLGRVHQAVLAQLINLIARSMKLRVGEFIFCPSLMLSIKPNKLLRN